MTSEPYLPLYVGDYMGDTMHLTLEQHGAYLLLLMTMWRSGGLLPNDEKKLSRICRVTVKKWRPIWAELRPFFTCNDEHISHKRIAVEKQKSDTLRAKRAAAGAIGGTAKSLGIKKRRVPFATAEPEQYHTIGNTPLTPLTSGPYPVVRRRRDH